MVLWDEDNPRVQWRFAVNTPDVLLIRLSELCTDYRYEDVICRWKAGDSGVPSKGNRDLIVEALNHYMGAERDPKLRGYSE